MNLYKDGEIMAFEVLYSRHQAKVFSFLERRLHSSDTVNEVFQNAFLKLHRFRTKYDDKYSFLQWIFTITKSELYDFCKKKNLDTVQFSEELHGEVDRESDFSLDDHQLKNNEREAIKLKFYSDKDYKEISQVLNTSTLNARKLVSRGISKLRAKLIAGDHE